MAPSCIIYHCLQGVNPLIILYIQLEHYLLGKMVVKDLDRFNTLTSNFQTARAVAKQNQHFTAALMATSKKTCCYPKVEGATWWFTPVTPASGLVQPVHPILELEQSYEPYWIPVVNRQGHLWNLHESDLPPVMLEVLNVGPHMGTFPRTKLYPSFTLLRGEVVITHP